MDLYTIMLCLVASLLYMFLFWLPKRIKADTPQDIDKVKVVRTVLWGLVVGVIMVFNGVSPSFSNVESVFATLSGMGAVVVLVDKGSLFVYRLLLNWSKTIF